MIEEMSPWLRSLHALTTLLQEDVDIKEGLTNEELASCQETTDVLSIIT
jgi:hypothetical protein